MHLSMRSAVRSLTHALLHPSLLRWQRLAGAVALCLPLAQPASAGEAPGGEAWAQALPAHPRHKEPGAQAYLKQIHERIHPRWSTFLHALPQLQDEAYQDRALATTVVFAVTPEGLLTTVARPALSGLPGYDDAAVDMLRDIDPLPSPPRELRSDDGLVYLRWHLLRQDPGCEINGVVERRRSPSEATVLLMRAGRGEEALQRVRAAYPDLKAEERRGLLRTLASELALAASRAATARERELAATALAQVLQLDAEVAIVALLDDSDPAVRRRALHTLLERPLTPRPVGLPWSHAVQTFEGARTSLRGALRRRLGGRGAEARDEQVLAAVMLLRLSDPSGRDYIRSLLVAGYNPADSAAQLVTIGDGEEARALTRALLDSDDSALQRAGAQAAAALRQPAAPLPAAPPPSSSLALAALGDLDPALLGARELTERLERAAAWLAQDTATANSAAAASPQRL